MLVFGSHETSDAWVDASRMWWLHVKAPVASIRMPSGVHLRCAGGS